MGIFASCLHESLIPYMALDINVQKRMCKYSNYKIKFIAV